MKLNIDYYNKEIDKKEIPEEYEEVLNKVNSVEDNFSKTLDKKSKIKNILALSEIRENILSWYNFKKDCSILELNAHYGEITGLLCRKAKKVVSVEKSLKFSKIIEKRYKKTDNLELYIGEISNIELKEEFDYVVIMGIAKELEKYLEFAKEHLKSDGMILIAVDNKFGIKSWTTLKDENQVVNNSKTAISKNRIKELLNELNYRFYYPFPDYKMANIIFTEEYKPNLSNINRDLTYKDEDVNFKEVDAFKEIIKEEPEKVLDYSNSFVIEASKKELEKNDINFITYSNIRKDKYRIKTIIKEKEVYKTSSNEKSIKHIENVKENIKRLTSLNINTLDSYDEEKIISKFCKEKTLDQILKERLKKEGIDSFIKEVNKYKYFLISKLEKVEKEKIENNNVFTKYKINIELKNLNDLDFVENGFWDLIFSNCFVIKNDLWFYDQEWFEKNIPVDFIIYRAIKYYNEIKEYVSEEEIYEKLGITDYIDLFDKLDDKLQENTRNPLFWRIHTKDELAKYKILKTREFRKELENQKNAYDKLQKEYNNLYDLYLEKNNELSILQNSVSWKITKPLRKIRSLKKKK